MQAEESYYAHKSPPQDPILSQLNPFHTHRFSYHNIHLHHKSPKRYLSLDSAVSELQPAPVVRACSTRPVSSLRFHPVNCWRLYTIILIIANFSPSSCSWSKYSSQQPFTPSIYLFWAIILKQKRWDFRVSTRCFPFEDDCLLEWYTV
jgi:hypothetical protein